MGFLKTFFPQKSSDYFKYKLILTFGQQMFLFKILWNVFILKRDLNAQETGMPVTEKESLIHVKHQL